MTTYVADGRYDSQLRGASRVAVRVGGALQNWGRRHAVVWDRDELEVRRWAENEARLANESRRAAQNMVLYQLIR